MAQTSFSDLHTRSTPLLLPNAWDPGSARMLEAAGAEALGTTSAGFAFGLGRKDGATDIDAVIENALAIHESVSVPVSVDLLNGGAASAEGVAENIARLIDAGVAGASIEDTRSDSDAPLFPFEEAVERVVAAVEAKRASGQPFVLTARADGFFSPYLERDDAQLSEVIARLQAYEEAGADVLYAPAIRGLDDLKAIAKSVSKPLNVLTGLPGMNHALETYASLGVSRLSVGSGLFAAGYGAARAVYSEWAEHGVVPTDGPRFDYGESMGLMR
ncbi:MAG: isocitrate lyase/phosphoenolpyruvate mutase family protein [Myxococcota bacterium]